MIPSCFLSTSSIWKSLFHGLKKGCIIWKILSQEIHSFLDYLFAILYNIKHIIPEKSAVFWMPIVYCRPVAFGNRYFMCRKKCCESREKSFFLLSILSKPIGFLPLVIWISFKWNFAFAFSFNTVVVHKRRLQISIIRVKLRLYKLWNLFFFEPPFF